MREHATGRVLFALAWLVVSASVALAETKIVSASFLGGSGDGDQVVGAVILTDGTGVLAANLASDTPALKGAKILGKVASSDSACVLRISPDGTKVLSATRLPKAVGDLAIDAEDNLYVPLAEAGVVKLDPTGQKVLASMETENPARRLDVSADGHLAVLTGGGHVEVFGPKGKRLGSFRGIHRTEDVAIDGKSETVIYVTWRQARAFDGKRTYPVQIAGMRGMSYDGKLKWNNYNWSTKRDAKDFLNRSTNNMADTRGYRVSMGADGKCYAAFESAGGNHIFRWSPKDITKPVTLAGGDKYHQFHNTRAEHKTVFCKYEPASGEVLAVQEFCGRLSSGRGNAVRVKDGAISADAKGRVLLTGGAAYGLPLTINPPKTGDYTGGGFALVMEPNLTQRALCTRLLGGKGMTSAAAIRTVKGKTMVLFGGGEMLEGMFTRQAIQDKPQGKDAYFAVVELDG